MESLLEHSHESFGESPQSKPQTDASTDFVGFKKMTKAFNMTASPKKENKTNILNPNPSPIMAIEED